MKELISLNKLKKLEKDLRKIEQEAENNRKYAERYARKRMAAVKKGNDKDIIRWRDKEWAKREIVKNLRLKIKSIEGEIADERSKLKETAYQKELEYFKREMKELLITLKENLEKNELVKAKELAEDMYKVWDKQQSKFNKEDLMPFSFLMTPHLGLPKPVLIRISHILEAFANAARVRRTIGEHTDAGWKGKAKLWTKQLISQIDDCIRMLEKR